MRRGCCSWQKTAKLQNASGQKEILCCYFPRPFDGIFLQFHAGVGKKLSFPEPFLSVYLLQAMDNIISCQRRGMEPIVWWQPKTFNYGASSATGDTTDENSWRNFFEPIGNISERQVRQVQNLSLGPHVFLRRAVRRVSAFQAPSDDYVVVNKFSVLGRILPFQFEHFINSRCDNLHEHIVEVFAYFRPAEHNY